MKTLPYVVIAVISFCATLILMNVLNSPDIDVNMGEIVETHLESTPHQSYYDQLTDYQKSIYNVLIGPISRAEDEFNIGNVQDLKKFEENCFTVTKAIQYDHPEFFWFTGGYRYTQSYNLLTMDGTIEFSPKYYQYTDYAFDSEEKMAILEKKVKEVASLAQSHSSVPYERITFVHDYLIKNAYYDHSALDEYYKTSHNPKCEYIFSAYGCLIDGKTVCSGYAKAFQLIMNELGFDCSYITGNAGEAHGWNCIFIDGEGYFVDVTWDDPDYKKPLPFYNHMCIDSVELSKTHTIDSEYFEEVVCTREDYDYYVYNGYFCKEYDLDEIGKIVELQKDNDAIYLKFSCQTDFEKAISELCRKGKIYSLPYVDKNDKLTYVTNTDHFTLTFIKNK